jgi:hypothetical protein
MTPQPQAELALKARARDMWRHMTGLQKEADALVLKLMAHPDATPEQLQTAHRVCSGAKAEHDRLRKILQLKWPPKPHTFNRDPWN